jgi:hypothetical protein
MKKVVRLTESDLRRIVKKVMREQVEDPDVIISNNNDFRQVTIKNKSTTKVDEILSKLDFKPDALAIFNCEAFNVDKHKDLICDNENLSFLNLKGTPHNMSNEKCNGKLKTVKIKHEYYTEEPDLFFVPNEEN